MPHAPADHTRSRQIRRKEPELTTLTIRNIDPVAERRLRDRAAANGRSMEDEARTILLAALNASEHLPGDTLYDRIRARFAPLGGIDLELPERQPAREPPHFDN